MKRYTWVMFDADNTLFDFDRAESQALRATFAHLAIPLQENYVRLYHRINAEIWTEFEQKRISALDLRVERFLRLFAEAGLKADAAAFGKIYLVYLARGADLLPGALEAVQALLRGGVRLALATNGLSDVQRPRLAASALGGCFEVIAVSEEIGSPKPEAGFYEAAFEMMGRPVKTQILMTGDGLRSDIQGGNAFGVDTCWFNPQGKPPDPRYPATFTVQTLTQVSGLVLNGANR